MKTIRLLHKHTHEGKTYQAGETVTLPDETVEWLVQFEQGYRTQLIRQREEAATPAKSEDGDAG